MCAPPPARPRSSDADIVSIALFSAACITPVGLSLPETAAATRARVAGLRASHWRDRRDNAFVLGRVPAAGLPALSPQLQHAGVQAREARMLRMAHAALAEALALVPAVERPIPLLLGLPEHHTQAALEPAAFLARLAIQSGAPLDRSRSVAAPLGRAAGLMAFNQAAALLDDDATPWVLVGGVDSLVDLYVLNTLDQQGRIRNERNSDGFTPGEGAAFLLLGKQGGGLAPIARIAACGHGHEAGHLYSDVPYLGEGLAALFGQVLQPPPPAPIGTLYASFNGERYWARELGVARLRHAAAFSDAVQIEHPAECFGDLGAAHGPVLAALAAHALANGYRPGPALVYASSDHGSRGAVLLERA